MTITETMHEYASSVAAYSTAAIAYTCSHIVDWPWMQIGAAVLLVAKLIQDVPKAYMVIRCWLRKRKAEKV